MITLDKTKIYDLSELTIEERKEVEKVAKIHIYNYKYLLFSSGWFVCSDGSKFCTETTNAKELFYTLENIQVDCRELSEEQIKEMANVFYNNKYENKCALDVLNEEVFLRRREYGVKAFGTYQKKEGLFLITYEKFMELFGNKEKSEEFNNLVEVLNEELTEEAYKETEYEVKYIAEKPKQYQIGIDTFQRCEANMTKEEILACVRFNIDKYNFRVKGQDLEDLEKIIAYANWGIKQLKQQ